MSEYLTNWPSAKKESSLSASFLYQFTVREVVAFLMCEGYCYLYFCIDTFGVVFSLVFFCVMAFGVETFVICSEDQPTKARLIVVVKRVSCCV